MSDKTLEDKAVEILDASQAAMGAFADKLAELANQYGPEVADAALQMARIDAASPFMWAIPLMAASCVTICIGYRFLKKGFKQAEEREKAIDSPHYYKINDGVASGVVGFVIIAASIFGLIASGQVMLNLWRWVGIFEPKLWLAKRILGL